MEKGLENAPKWFKLSNSGKLNTMKFPTIEIPVEEEAFKEAEVEYEEESQIDDNEGDGWGDEIGDLQVNEEGGWGDEIGDIDLNPTEEKHSSLFESVSSEASHCWSLLSRSVSSPSSTIYPAS